MPRVSPPNGDDDNGFGRSQFFETSDGESFGSGFEQPHDVTAGCEPQAPALGAPETATEPVADVLLPAVVQCPVIAIIQGVRGAVLGFGFGAITGIWQGAQFGARGLPLLQAATATACGSAGSFGGFLGVSSGVRCGAAAARGRSDLLNVGIAGAAAGAAGTLRSRNPCLVAGSAAVGGALMIFMESIQ